MIQENEIPKYLKQKESNISKSNRKSKHKHHYEECLIQYRSTFAGKTCLNTGLYTYCTIWGQPMCNKYAEVTYNRDKDEMYVDIYQKIIHNQISFDEFNFEA